MSSNESKWAQTSLNEPTWTERQNRPKLALMSSEDPKYTQNDPLWPQNKPKWAQMSLNEFKF